MSRFSVDVLRDGACVTLSRHNTLAEAVKAAPRRGEPVRTGAREWAFVPEPTNEVIAIHDCEPETA